MKLIYALLFVLLAGCATPEPVVRTVEVKVPVREKCTVQVDSKPIYATKLIDPNSDIWVQNKAFRAELEQRKTREDVLETAVESCKN